MPLYASKYWMPSTFATLVKVLMPAKKIPEEDINLILEAGRLSPSSFGFEPWRFLLIQKPGAERKNKAG